MNPESSNPVDVYIIGTGITLGQQLTRENISALQNSEKIYLVSQNEILREYLEETFTADIIELNKYYEEGKHRGEVYDQFAEILIDSAESTDAPITFALYGHPTVFVSPSRKLVKMASDTDLTIDVQPGISAVDCIYADHCIDPAEGMQMFEATDVLLREIELNPKIPCLIWQINSLETHLYTERQSSEARFLRFKNYLTEYYPEDHTVRLLQARVYPIERKKQISVKIGNFEQIAGQVGVEPFILHIPPKEQKPVQNEELLSKAQSMEHIDRVTEEQ